MVSWRYIRREVGELISCAGPSIVISISVLSGGAIGASGSYNSWLIVLPMMLAGCALGWARDQAIARAKAEANGAFIKALTTGLDTNISVTFLDECPSPSKEGE